MKRILSLIIFGIAVSFMPAQAQSEHHIAERKELTELSDFFIKGQVHGHLRNYFMSTWNQAELSDHYANALGAKIGWRSAEWKGLSVGLAGLFTFNTFSSDLSSPDPVAGSLPSFERQLFDLPHPENKHDMDRLEELYLQYRWKNSYLRFGRQLIQSPLVNPQDGRMKPYAAQGSWLSFGNWKPAKVQVGWITHFSPRSTTEWYTAGESVGIYGQGVDTSGLANTYADTLEVPGLLLLNVHPNLGKGLSADLWYYQVPNLLHTGYIRLQHNIPLSEESNVFLGLEGLLLNSLSKEEATNQLYISASHKSWLWGAQAGLKHETHSLSLNYLSIAGDQFLFPREWGREHFFATLARARMEGLTNSNTFSVHYSYAPKPNWQADLEAAHFSLPSVEQFQHNKYGIPSGIQFNGSLNYHFKGKLKGLQTRLLYVYRRATEAIPLTETYYKANYHHLNLVTQISF